MQVHKGNKKTVLFLAQFSILLAIEAILLVTKAGTGTIFPRRLSVQSRRMQFAARLKNT